jgi:hypothetical protein
METSAQRAEGSGTMTKETLQHILAAHEDLGAYGWKHRGFTPEQHEISRSEMTSDDYVQQFERATEYLSHRRRRKTVWKRGTSYGWKHQAEHYFESSGNHQYISNGMFIAAAINLGFVVQRIPNSPNCFLNISASESYCWRGDGRFLNRRSGKWMTFEEVYGMANP